ncbi:MAG: hypothetical protein IJ505_03100, partial [Succinivibrio sp.]|nr:hypothetical protein [Succinivibrio sp.]
MALALNNSVDEVNNVYVAIGMPVDEFGIMEKLQEYRDYIFQEGPLSIRINKNSEGQIIEKEFNIVGRYVYPESAGDLYLDPIRYENKTVGVGDFGNLNVNLSLWDNFDYDAN